MNSRVLFPFKVHFFAVFAAVAMGGCAYQPTQPEPSDGHGGILQSESGRDEQDNNIREGGPVGDPVEFTRHRPGPPAQKMIAMALQLINDEQYEEAENWLERAQRISPSAGEVYLAMARLKWGQGRKSETAQLCGKARSLAGRDQRFRLEVDRTCSAYL